MSYKIDDKSTLNLKVFKCIYILSHFLKNYNNALSVQSRKGERSDKSRRREFLVSHLSLIPLFSLAKASATESLTSFSFFTFTSKFMKSIAVFCGSSKGANPIYARAARALGEALVQRKLKMVYGAGNVGLMGVIADAMLEKGGYVIGVIPDFLKEKEVCHGGLTELFLVKTMHERKVKMAELSDGVIVLPGGYGTLDELFEMVTLIQLGQDDQPIGILNVNGYYDPLLQQIERMHSDRFLRSFHKDMIMVETDIEALLDRMENYQPIKPEGKWWEE